MIIVTTLIYLNHFDNGFHFDDVHTILENPNIRSLRNTGNFFLDGSTISSLPQNQSYRPLVTTSLAFDYWLGNGYNPIYFHISSFLLFLLQGVLLFFFLKKILKPFFKQQKIVFYTSCGITLFYMLHPVMAETVNYIIARSDLQSTFFVLLAFVLYQYSAVAKRYHLYLAPIFIGILCKPTTLMFAPLLFCYQLIFEKKSNFLALFSKKHLPSTLQTIKSSAPSFIVCALLFVFHQSMTPDTFYTGSTNTFGYLITQPSSISYYFISAFLPIHLSADTDWKILESIWSIQFFLSILFVITLIAIAFITSKTKRLTPISFGIAWFFIALVPTSSIIPLAEVLNDHRMFFPYIGLCLSIGYAINLFILYVSKRSQNNTKHIIPITIAILLITFSFTTYNRNEIWHNEESLWKDVTIKSPKNSRGLMNYGLTQMAKGNYDIAENYFLQALDITPYYHSLHINIGILYNTKKNKNKAESHFKNAIKYGSKYYSPWYYYGRFLLKNKKPKEAINNLSKSLEISPQHIPTRLLLMEVYLENENWSLLNNIAKKTLQIDLNNQEAQKFLEASIKKISKLDLEEIEIAKNPSDKKYLSLSLKYYQKEQYEKCIIAAKKALKLNNKLAEAYNNICISQNLLGDFEQATIACTKALELKPNFQLAKNNLNDVLIRKNNISNHTKKLEQNQSEQNYLNLSLQYYNYALFEYCIKIAQQGIIKHPNSDNLYNNICAAYNALKNWNKAIEAGKKGLDINPQNKLLRNNYNYSIESKKKHNE